MNYKIQGKQIMVNNKEDLNNKISILFCNFAFTQNEIFVIYFIFRNRTFWTSSKVRTTTYALRVAGFLTSSAELVEPFQ